MINHIIKCIIFILLISYNVNLFASDEENEPRLHFGIVGYYGFSYGIQSVSIPPFMNKVSAGIQVEDKHFEFYILPGFTGGIAPAGYLNLESGISIYNFSFDYSFNKFMMGTLSSDLFNHNLNIGYKVKIFKKKEVDFCLWFKMGKAFKLINYVENDYEPLLNSYNIELKVGMTLFKIK